jgi:hypothetical protein
MRFAIRAVVFSIALIIVTHSNALAQGCAMCRTALESSPEGRLLAGSFAQGILMLLFLPYLIFGTIAFAVYRAYRKNLKQKQA